MVGKIEVIYTSSVISYLNDLVVILYKKQYFGFIESADEYVDEIYDAIPERIKKSPHKKTPKPLKYLGSNYVFYKVNTRTTWYVFFERRDQNFLITGITNNHCIEAKEL